MAKIQAELARGVGADFRILDPQGRTVGRGEGRRTSSAGGGRVDGTLGGGFQATPTPRLPTDPALLAKSKASAPTQEARIVPTPKGPVTTSGLDLLPPEGETVAHIAPKPGQDLDALDADDLVMLDGTAEEQQKAPARPLGLEQSPVAASAFRAPTQDEELELDEEPGARTRPTPKTAPRPPAPSAAPPLESDGVIDDIPPLDDLMPTTTPPAAPAPLPEMMPPPGRTAPVARELRQTGRGHAAARRGPAAERVLFGGWFRARTRARIVVGFLVALGLGSVAPIIQSRSVVSSRIVPEMQELSTARAYPALARLANLRTPEDIEESISGTKSRHGVTSFLIWLVGTGLLAFLWFRFV
jgi:hypothetical protein